MTPEELIKAWEERAEQRTREAATTENKIRSSRLYGEALVYMECATELAMELRRALEEQKK